MKKICALLLSICMVVSVMPLGVFATDAVDPAPKTLYDMGEGMEITDTFTTDTAKDNLNYRGNPLTYAADGVTVTAWTGLTLKYANSEENTASPWKYGAFSNQGDFVFATTLGKPHYVDGRAPTDTVTPSKTTKAKLRWGFNGVEQKGSTTFSYQVIGNSNYGNVAYNFGQHGDCTSTISNIGDIGVRFIVPRDGLIRPKLILSEDSIGDGTQGDGNVFR